MDTSKILLCVKWSDMQGNELAEVLRKKYHLEMEMSCMDYVLALTSVGDSEEGLNRLVRAIVEIDEEIEKKKKKIKEIGMEEEKGKEGRKEREIENKIKEIEMEEQKIKEEIKVDKQEIEFLRLKETMDIARAMENSGDSVKLKESIGKTSREFAYLYPPGIPLLVPGEVISEELVEQFFLLKSRGFEIEGLKDYSGDFIEIVV